MKEILSQLFNHECLTSSQTEDILLNITKQKYSDAQISAMLTVFQLRGITVDELLGFRSALIKTRVPVSLDAYRPIDIVGTGGDGKNTFNISTCACFVVAGAGYKVAKHGNYGATSVSGASNVMEEHGIRFTNDQSLIERSMEQCGMVYMHAPLFNPAMKYVAPVRKALQMRTIFNLLGPLVNPCKPAYQLLGVADLSQMRLYTNVFQRMGVGFSVVSSLDCYDEISLTSEFKVSTMGYESIFRPEDLGFTQVEQLALFGGKTTGEAAQIFDEVLQNTATKAQKQCVIANAAFAIKTIDTDKNIDECVAIATESVESGRALSCLQKFVEINS